MAWSSSSSSSAGGHGGSGGASSGGSGASSSPSAAFFAQRQLVTNRMMRYWAAGICGLLAVFVVFHWARWLCVKIERSKRPAGMLGRPFVATTRLVRNVLVRKVPGFKSAGHAITVSCYVAINAAVIFTNVDTSSVGGIASRLGWVMLGNLSLIIFLALKNTPLAFLTAYSYERLNCLHQIAGYTMFLELILHASFYTSYFNSEGMLSMMFAERAQIAAIVAGFAFFGVVFSATFIRRVWYELFYVTHVACWIMAIVAVGFHQPDFGKGAIIITLLAASMWFSDRLIRASRVLYYSLNNEATLHPLPNGGTKIVLKKVPARAVPGKHCFVWIPAIRKFETHPFTIHGSSPFVFTVKACNGFTRDLHKYAVAHPGAAVRASVDGPYGTFPDPMDFDKIVLIAGGGGATFTTGLAVNILERMDDAAPKHVVFIWSVPEHENLFWFKEQLEFVRTHAHSPKVNVSLYVTRSTQSSTSDLLPNPTDSSSNEHSGPSDSSSEGAESPPLSPVSGSDSDPEKTGAVIQTPPATATAAAAAAAAAAPTRRWRSLTSSDSLEKEMSLEKQILRAVETGTENAAGTTTPSTTAAARTFLEYAVRNGRPDAAALIREAVRTTPPNQRVLVAACGPDGLMRVVRDTTARLIVGEGPAVELHCEQFGW